MATRTPRLDCAQVGDARDPASALVEPPAAWVAPETLDLRAASDGLRAHDATGAHVATLTGLADAATCWANSPSRKLVAASDGAALVVWKAPKV